MYKTKKDPLSFYKLCVLGEPVIYILMALCEYYVYVMICILMLSIKNFEQMIVLIWNDLIFNHEYYSDLLGEKSTWYEIPPKVIPVAV